MATSESKLFRIDKTDYPVDRYRKHFRTIDAKGNTVPEVYEHMVFSEQNDDIMIKVSSGEENRLDLIASREDIYNNENLWWIIAEANNILDPFSIPAGTVLRIPPIRKVYGYRGILS